MFHSPAMHAIYPLVMRHPLLRVATGTLLSAFALAVPTLAHAQKRHNVIIFVADGLRRGSVTAQDMPTFLKLRSEGVDFRNSHSVFPTFTTANASVIATGHGLGDTGDYSNTIYPGVRLAKPDPITATTSGGFLTPFLENDEVLANMNSVFHGNYLGERTLLSVAAEKGYHVASIGKLGPTAIQLNDRLTWTEYNTLSAGGQVVIDDSTGTTGFPLPPDITEAITKAGLSPDTPSRNNGYGDKSQNNNGYSGDARNAGTLDSNHVQQQWYADIATKVLLPTFTQKPDDNFVLLFWSRDPDGTQHNEGDSLQNLAPGINGDTAKRGLRNADHALKQLIDWLDAHPAIKANTDVLVTSDHGFATISRRDIGPKEVTHEVSSHLSYLTPPLDPPGTLPSGFLAIDLGTRLGLRVFDSTNRATDGNYIYKEVVFQGEDAHTLPLSAQGSAILSQSATRIDGQDADAIIAANGGSDLVYVPTKNPETVKKLVDTILQLDYVGGVFVDDQYCASKTDCLPGALPMTAIGLVGKSSVPRPAIVVNYKTWYQTPGDLQSAVQVSDTTLQQGQGMHGGFGREQTFNNMAAIGPDFRAKFADELPMGNIDIVPTLAHILGIDMPSNGTLKGRVVTEALAASKSSENSTDKAEAVKKSISSPAAGGLNTVLEYQQKDGVTYYDRACLTTTQTCQ